MVVATDHRAKDHGSVHVTLWVVVSVMVLEAGQNLRVLYFVQTFVVLWEQPLLEENYRVLMSVADKALVLLAQLPLVWCVNLEKSLPWNAVKMWILVPNQLWVVNLSGEHERINLSSMVSPYALACFWPKFHFVLFDERVLLDHHQLVFIVFLTNDLFLFLFITAAQLTVDLVLSLGPCNSFHHEFVPLLNSLNHNQSFLFR